MGMVNQTGKLRSRGRRGGVKCEFLSQERLHDTFPPFKLIVDNATLNELEIQSNSGMPMFVWLKYFNYVTYHFAD